MNRYRERLGLLPSAQPGASYNGIRDGIVNVLNTTASAVSRYGILQLGTPVITPDDSSPVTYEPPNLFNGILPVTDYNSALCGFGKFAVVMATSIAANAIGPCCMAGLAHVKLSAPNGDWNWCDISDGITTQLVTHAAGSAAIVWRGDRDADTGLYNAVINMTCMSNNAAVDGVAVGACAFGATGVCRPNVPALRADQSTGDNDISYLNMLANVDDGAFMVIHWSRHRNRFILGPATCVT